MLNGVLSVVVVLAFVVFALALAKGFMWLAFWLASLVPQTGSKHRHSRWGEDVSRRK